MKSDLTDIPVEVYMETPKAYLVSTGATYNSSDEIYKSWIPKSQCEFDEGILTLPEWLALEKGLI